MMIPRCPAAPGRAPRAGGASWRTPPPRVCCARKKWPPPVLLSGAVKLLIIAGPYEADRIRRAVVQAGFEAVAVEPGESLSGWITASRPDLIVLAPQIVSPDPAAALAKVRSVPRGRVPTFLVGDPDDEARMQNLADRV